MRNRWQRSNLRFVFDGSHVIVVGPFEDQLRGARCARQLNKRRTRGYIRVLRFVGAL